MAPRTTRSAKSALTKELSDVPAAKFTKRDTDHFKLFILPNNVSNQSEIITLPRAATGGQNRYLFCPDSGLHEYTKNIAPQKGPRSWLLSTAQPNSTQNASLVAHDTLKQTTDLPLGHGYVQSNADFYIATPFDLLFLAGPLFATQSDAKPMFRLLDDHVDTLCKDCPALERLFQKHSFKDLFEKSLSRACHVQNLGDETAYKPDTQLLLQELMRKAKTIVTDAWAASMETSLVQKPLQVPMTIAELSKEELIQKEQEDSAAGVGGQEAGAKVSLLELQIPDTLLHLQRLQTSLRYMMYSYLAPALRDYLWSLLSSQTEIDFEPLNSHLAKVKQRREEARALRAVSDNITRKRSALEDEEEEQARAEKKRRKDEEEKKLKAESRAIKQLKKADTSGMKKLSSFFSKSVPTLTKSETAP